MEIPSTNIDLIGRSGQRITVLDGYRVANAIPAVQNEAIGPSACIKRKHRLVQWRKQQAVIESVCIVPVVNKLSVCQSIFNEAQT